MATNYDFRILIETISGSQYSYGTGSFVSLDNTSVILTTSESLRRINDMPEIQYYNGKTFTTSSGLFERKDPLGSSPSGGPRKFNNTNIDGSFTDYQFVSCSVVGDQSSGSLKFSINETFSAEKDHTKRYKFFGNKVCSVLGLPENYWIYSDSFRLSNTGSEVNYMSGDLLAQSVNIKSNFAISNAGSIETDLPFKHAKDSDRWLKWTDVSGSIPTNDMMLGYSNLNDRYELRMQNDDPFLIDSPNINLSGSVTASGNVILKNNVNGGDAVLNIFNVNSDTGTDKGATLEFNHGIGGIAAAGTPAAAGKIVAGKVDAYDTSNACSSNLQFFTSFRNSNNERMRLTNSQLELYNDLTITGEAKANHAFPQLTLTDDSYTDKMEIGLDGNLFKFKPSDIAIDYQFLNSNDNLIMYMDNNTQRIGIQEANPSAELDISGSFMLSHDIGVQGLSFEEPSREETTIRFDSERLRFWSTSEKLTILSASANVGINAPNPTKALQVTGDVSASGQYYGYQAQHYSFGSRGSNMSTQTEEFITFDTMYAYGGGTGAIDASGYDITRVFIAPFDGFVKKALVLTEGTPRNTTMRIYKGETGTTTPAMDNSSNRMVDAGVTVDITTDDTSFLFSFDSAPGGDYEFSAGDRLALSLENASSDIYGDVMISLVLMYNVT